MVACHVCTRGSISQCCLPLAKELQIGPSLGSGYKHWQREMYLMYVLLPMRMARPTDSARPHQVVKQVNDYRNENSSQKLDCN